jgi:2-C-methyl-D-erythritol 4-phosphate cytidylyltransferase/2-C-methyl-D-erythritol 2,4-cyclodiphosphate synthase
LLALKLPDTLKAEVQGRVTATVTREDKWLAQTPQMFRIRDLYCALALAEADGFTRITDEASAIEALGLQPLLVTGRADNLKLTYPDDFMLADAVLRARQQQAAAVAFTDLSPAAAMPLMAQAPPPVAPSFLGLSPPPSPSPSAGMTWRMGEGWDCHALVPGRALVLGGVTVPHHLGLLGHSDADVLLHAIIDALLGAAGLGDIGRHFPDTDARFRGADSAMLLTETMQRVQAGGWRLVNLDCTVVAQAPKLAPHIPAMQARIAQTLGVAITQVNVKAKTAEKLGPVGQGLSMEARAVVMLSSS